jgi:hypothetical protein
MVASSIVKSSPSIVLKKNMPAMISTEINGGKRKEPGYLIAIFVVLTIFRAQKSNVQHKSMHTRMYTHGHFFFY